MKIVIASGKGGTGKTTVATNLARSFAKLGKQAQYLDCDVEEPNGHIFLKPRIEKTQEVTISVPEVDPAKCSGCGKCGELCQFSAIVCLQKEVLVFEQLCHSCGGCMLVCPETAIAEGQKGIGMVEVGTADGVKFVQGRLKVGDIHTTSLIKQVKQNTSDGELAILDAPPGTSCPVVEAVRGADLVLLVTEPTPFGLNDLKLAVGMVKQLGLDLAVVVNRSDGRDDYVRPYCIEEDIDILLDIPDDRRIAEAYSSGRMLIDDLPEYQPTFALFCAFLEGQRPNGLRQTESENDVQRGAESRRLDGRLAGPSS